MYTYMPIHAHECIHARYERKCTCSQVHILSHTHIHHTSSHTYSTHPHTHTVHILTHIQYTSSHTHTVHILAYMHTYTYIYKHLKSACWFKNSGNCTGHTYIHTYTCVTVHMHACIHTRDTPYERGHIHRSTYMHTYIHTSNKYIHTRFQSVPTKNRGKVSRIKLKMYATRSRHK